MKALSFSGFAAWSTRLLLLLSAVFLALVLSGGIFQIIPGITIAHARGGSMEPTFKEGDVVLIRDFDGKRAEVNDIIVFQEGPIAVMHRVIEVGYQGEDAARIIAQGDANPRPDAPLTAADIDGKYLLKIPLLGEISRALGTGGGFYAYRYAVLLLSLATVFGYTAHTLRKPRSQNRLDTPAG